MKKTAIIVIIALVAAFAVAAGIYLYNKKNIDDGKGQVAFEYKGSEMVYMSSSKEIPSEYTLSGENVTINKCSLLISGRKYELYTSDSTDEIVYIYVDDDVVAKQNQGYWQFVSTEIYNDT